MTGRCDANTTNTKTKKWTIKLLHYIEDISRVNAQTVYCLNRGIEPRSSDSWKFGWDLAFEMIMPHLKRRRNILGVQKSLILKIDARLVIKEKVSSK